MTLFKHRYSKSKDYTAYVQKIKVQIEKVNEKNSEINKYCEQLNLLIESSTSKIENFEKSLYTQNLDVKKDVLNVTLILKKLIDFKENKELLTIPSEVNEFLAQIDGIKKDINHKDFIIFIQNLHGLDDVNDWLKYLKTDEYKKKYEKAEAYYESKRKVSFFKKCILPVIALSIGLYIAYYFYFRYGWIIKGLIIMCGLVGIGATLGMIGEYRQAKKTIKINKKFVKKHPECKDMYIRATANGQKPFKKYE